MKKRKNFDKNKKLKPILIGSHYTFDVRDPLGEMPAITNTGYGHKNPISALMLKKSIRSMHSIFNSHRLKWRASIAVEFRNEKEVYERHSELVWFGLLQDCEGEYQGAIESIFDKAKMAHYVICHIKAEVIGINEIQENDFTIKKRDAA